MKDEQLGGVHRSYLKSKPGIRWYHIIEKNNLLFFPGWTDHILPSTSILETASGITGKRGKKECNKFCKLQFINVKVCTILDHLRLKSKIMLFQMFTKTSQHHTTIHTTINSSDWTTCLEFAARHIIISTHSQYSSHIYLMASNTLFLF